MTKATNSRQIDSRVRVVTPENIAFEYRVAGPFGRVMAHLIDLVILLIIYGLIVLVSIMIMGLFGLPGAGLLVMLACLFAAYWFYGGLFEATWNGQTPGKRMVGLRALRTDGRPVTAIQAVLRNLLRFVDAYPWFLLALDEEMVFWCPTYLVALVAMTLTERSQRLGDLVVGTMVVVEESSRFGKVPAPEEPGLDALIDKLPASFAPSRTLSRSLSHYVGRRRFFGPARRQEIAQHVGAPLVAQLGLPPDTNHDLLLCALYVRAFHDKQLGDRQDELIAPRVPVPAEEPAPPPRRRPPTPTADLAP